MKPSVGDDAHIGPPYRTPCNFPVGAGVPDSPLTVNPRTLKNPSFYPALFQLSSPPLAPRPTLW